MRLGPLTYALPLLEALPLAATAAKLLVRSGAESDASPAADARESGSYAGGDLPLALKTALDRAACAYRLLWGPCPSAADWQRIVRETDHALRLYRTNGWLADPESFHAPPPPLEEPQTMTRRSRGRAFEHVWFESGYAPHPESPGRERWLSYEANRVAHAWVLRHVDGPRPWIVCIHGYGMGYPFVDFEGFPLRKFHEQLGLNVLLPVLPLHGPRRIGRLSGDRFLDGNPLDTIHAEAQAMWDLRRLLSWVRAQDATAIGLYGLSLGGYNAALLASLERDLSCVIAGIPAVDFLRLGRLHSRRTTLECAVRSGICWEHVAQILRVVAPLAMRPKVARDRLFIFAGSGDLVVPPEQATDLWNHWQRPRLEWYRGGHFSFRWEAGVRRLLAEAIEHTMRPAARTGARAA